MCVCLVTTTLNEQPPHPLRLSVFVQKGFELMEVRRHEMNQRPMKASGMPPEVPL